MSVKKLSLFLIAIAVVIGLFVLKTLMNAGHFKTIIRQSNYSCSAKGGVPGPEDIVIDRKSGTVLISFTDRRAAMKGEHPRGGISAYNPATPAVPPKLLTGNFKGPFTPHGISLYEKPDGTRLLFVINMGMDSHFFESTGSSVVEVFEYKQNMLIHRDTIKGNELTSPNDILGVGPRQFYVSIDHGASSPLGKKLENYLQLPISYVLYYDGRQFHKAAGGIAYANGLALSPDGRRLYAGATVGRKIHVYERNPSNGKLTKLDTVKTGTGVDNLDVDDSGVIWAGCHPKLLAFVKHSKDPAALSPSEILRVTPLNNGKYDITRVYLDPGEELSGSSVAVSWNNRLFIGAVYEDHFLDCTLKSKK
ncbi:MAG TPA: hypothetical protein ENN21_06890 [Spirochaetes bacterium]|nr:hypothetical protein [Spirochaetota bacterium]